MFKILLPVDGSKNSLHGVAHVVRTYRGMPDAQVLLVNVQPVMHRHVARFLARDCIRGELEARGQTALAAARSRLAEVEMACESHVLVGNTGLRIARFAHQQAVDLIVVGAGRRSALQRVLRGSVTERVIEHTRIPVAVIAGERPGPLWRYGVPVGVGATMLFLAWE